MSSKVDPRIFRAAESTALQLFDLALTGKFERSVGLQFGPFHIRLCCQTESLLQAVAPQFGLIVRDIDKAPDLTISLMEARAPLESLQNIWSAISLPKPHTSTSFRQDKIRIHAEFDDHGLAILFALNIETRQAVYAAASTERLKAIEGAYPLLLLLRLWSEQTSHLWAHGAAVGTDKAAVLITGIGGAGKSSTSLSVTGGRLRMIGDDHVLVSPDLQAYSIYCTVRLRQDMFERFRKIDPWFGDQWFYWRDKPSQILPKEKYRFFGTNTPLKAVVLLRHNASDPLTFHPVSQNAGFRAITPVTVTRHYSDPMATFEKVSQIISSLPVYEFRTSTDLNSMREPFERFVDSLGSSHD
jgi:hypothetical protein